MGKENAMSTVKRQVLVWGEIAILNYRQKFQYSNTQNFLKAEKMFDFFVDKQARDRQGVHKERCANSSQQCEKMLKLIMK